MSTMYNHRLIILVFCGLIFSFLCSCRPEAEEAQTPVMIRYNDFKTEVFYVSADQTSMDGHWMMTDDALIFLDEYVPGVKQYDLKGNYVKDCIRHGRARNEIISPVVAVAKDIETSTFCFLDSEMTFSIFDFSFENRFKTTMPFFYEFDKGSEKTSWKQLLEHPDPRALKMYEYLLRSDRVVSCAGRVTLPVETTHRHYNGYERGSRAKEVWRKVFAFMSFDCRNISGTAKLWGKYPAVYQKRNLPVFSAPDICATESGFLVSFPADPKIYVYDIDGNLTDSFGVARPDIGLDFPETRTIQEYDREYNRMRQQKGFYGRLYLSDKRLFRQYYSDAGTYGVQIYEGQCLVGEIPLAEPLEILGEKDGVYYAYIRAEVENERFKFVRFSLKQ